MGQWRERESEYGKDDEDDEDEEDKEDENEKRW